MAEGLEKLVGKTRVTSVESGVKELDALFAVIGADSKGLGLQVLVCSWTGAGDPTVEAMRYAAISGEPLGKYPDKISVSHPLTMDDVTTAFRDAICSDRSTAMEYAEWMEYGGQGGWPVNTTAERTTLADAYLAVATSREAR